MFLKKDRFNLNNTSITTRLTLFYSVTTCILLIIIALCLYGATVHILHKANYQFLSNEVDILTKILKKKPLSWFVLEQKVVDVPYTETGSVYHYYIRILNEKSQSMIETPQMGSAFQNADFFKRAIKLQGKEVDWWNAQNGRNYLLIQAPVVYSSLNKTWRIQIALDITYQQVMIKKWLWILLISLALGTISAIWLGYFIACKGMGRLKELTEATKQITATSLHQQFDPESWPAELKTLAIAFNQMLKRIEASFSRLMQFSADLAHELRTPVNNLMGETEILLSRDGSIEEYQQLLGSNLEELHRISQIIDNLLFLARAENLQLDIKKSLLNISNEINFICEYYQAMADEKNIKVFCQQNSYVKANSIMFRRIISNLLSNALKYTNTGGLINFDISETDSHIHIKVSDNGVGIASEHLPNVFNRFYRIDTARSKHSGGTGLGLAIVKSIMELHQGSISIQSILGVGTEISLAFPK